MLAGTREPLNKAVAVGASCIRVVCVESKFAQSRLVLLRFALRSPLPNPDAFCSRRLVQRFPISRLQFQHEACGMGHWDGPATSRRVAQGVQRRGVPSLRAARPRRDRKQTLALQASSLVNVIRPHGVENISALVLRCSPTRVSRDTGWQRATQKWPVERLPETTIMQC
jgi:hypothetical protein